MHEVLDPIFKIKKQYTHAHIYAQRKEWNDKLNLIYIIILTVYTDIAIVPDILKMIFIC